MRVVADTNVVVSGLLWRGNPRLVLEAARDGRIDLHTSGVLLDELEDVLRREKFAVRLQAAGVGAHELVLGYGALAKVIEPAMIEPVVHADPDDDAVIACALSSQSKIIVSGDNHLIGFETTREHSHHHRGRIDRRNTLTGWAITYYSTLGKIPYTATRFFSLNGFQELAPVKIPRANPVFSN